MDQESPDKRLIFGSDSLVRIGTVVAFAGLSASGAVWASRQDDRAQRNELAIAEMVEEIKALRGDFDDGMAGYVKLETFDLFLQLLKARNQGTIDIPDVRWFGK